MTNLNKIPLEIDPSHICQAFQSTAEMCGGDIIQCCIDCGEKPVVDRDGLIDYLEIHGGEHGGEVYRWCLAFPGNMEDLHKELTRLRVPKTWS